MRTDRQLPFALLVVSSLFAAPGAHAQDEWSYELVPFLWTAGIDGRTGVNRATFNVDASFDDLVEFVDVGAAARLFARRPPVGWFIEVNYVELGDDGDTPIGPIGVEITQTLAEGGLMYELNAAFAVYGGVRFQQADTVIRTPGLRLDDDKSWADAIIGARWTPLRSDSWVLWARGDVGGGSSDLVWLAEAGGGYRWPSRWAVYVAYRLLDTDYESGGFTYDIRQDGLMFGVGIRF